MTVEATGNKEEPAKYYDNVYSRVGGYPTERFSEIYEWTMHFLFIADSVKILECGCGVGVLAEQIINEKYEYHGFDFSGRAIRSCPLSVQQRVRPADAYSVTTWNRHDYDTVVAIEVFEHLQDLKILKFIPKDTRVIFSVPNFNSRSHLRTYKSIKDIKEYYSGVLDIIDYKEIRTKNSKRITVCNAIKI